MSIAPHFDTLAIDIDHDVVRVAIDRPDARNALSGLVVRELGTLCDFLDASPDLRVVILGSRNGVFCAGGDIAGFAKNARTDATDTETARAVDTNLLHSNETFGKLLLRIQRLSQVVIACVEGAAIGGGVGLACSTDIVIAAADARFALSETRIGLVPAQIAPLLLARIGSSATRRMALTGRTFEGRAALEIGLVDAVADTADQVATLCDGWVKDILRCSPQANAATKALLLTVQDLAPEERPVAAARVFVKALRSADGQEGIEAFLDKRRPAWTLRRENVS